MTRIAYGYAAVVGLIGAQIAYFDGALPDVVASHFGAGGAANGYMSRGEFVGFYVGLVVFLWAVFGGTSLLLRTIPAQLINVPNKDYWFAAERETDSRAWLSRELLAFGLVVVLFVAAIMQGVFITNVSNGRPCFPTPYLLACMGGLLVAVVTLAFRMMRRFS